MERQYTRRLYLLHGCAGVCRTLLRNEGQLLEMKGNGGDAVSDSVLFKQQLHGMVLALTGRDPVPSEEVRKSPFVSSAGSLVLTNQLAAGDRSGLFPVGRGGQVRAHWGQTPESVFSV